MQPHTGSQRCRCPGGCTNGSGAGRTWGEHDSKTAPFHWICHFFDETLYPKKVVSTASGEVAVRELYTRISYIATSVANEVMELHYTHILMSLSTARFLSGYL